MKKYVFTLFFAFTCIVATAQYKKASFLNKSGRTHDLGATAHLLSGGRSMAPGVFYSYGRDKGTKRLFHWFDLELVLPYNFKYKTIDEDMVTPVTVTGKSKMSFIYRYNLACYLLDNTNEDNKFLPFVTGGVNVVLAGGNPKTSKDDPEYSAKIDYLPYSAFGLGANAGVGVIYNLTSKIGLKGAVGYNYQYNTTSEEIEDDKYKPYYMLTSHPYVSIGVRFTMEED